MGKMGRSLIGSGSIYDNPRSSGSSGKKLIFLSPRNERKKLKINKTFYEILSEYKVSINLDGCFGSIDINCKFIEEPYNCAKIRNIKNKRIGEIIKTGHTYKTIEDFVDKVNRSKGSYKLLFNGGSTYYISNYSIVKK